MITIPQKNKIIHPFLFAIFPVLFLFSHNIDQTLLTDFLVPASLIILVSFIVFIGLGFAFKNYIKSALFVSLSAGILFLYGHFYNLLQVFSTTTDIFVSNLIPIISFFIIFTTGSIYLIKAKRKFDNLTKILNIISISIVAISMINIISFYITTDFSSEFYNDSEVIMLEQQNLPDIYYIILDGYPSSDNLEKYLDYDNSSFMDFLKEKGFYVATQSWSNYPTTITSLTSSLNMEYINYLFGDQEGQVNYHSFIEDTDKNKVMIKVKQKGYTIINFDSGYRLTRHISTADQNLCSFNQITNSEFIIILLETSLFKPIYSKFFEQSSRDRVLCPFSEIPQLQNKYQTPIFVFAHFVAPHQPFLFGPNGEPIYSNTLTLDKDKWDTKKFLDQLTFINKKTQELVIKILNDSEAPPIIVIQGDHGSGASELDWNDPKKDSLQKRMGILNAYYLPDGGENHLSKTITPVNSFRVIFNYYFNENYEILEDKNFFLKGGPDLKNSEIIDVTHILNT